MVIKSYPEYGAPRPIAVSVLDTLTEICRSNSARSKLILTNDSDTVIYLHLTDGMTVNQGIRINPNGGSYIDEPDNTGKMWKGGIWAIAAAAGGKILSGYEIFG